MYHCPCPEKPFSGGKKSQRGYRPKVTWILFVCNNPEGQYYTVPRRSSRNGRLILRTTFNKLGVCETFDQVQCSINMMSRCYCSPRSAVAYPGFFFGCPETPPPPPPGHDYFFNQGVDTILAPTFTSHKFWKPPPETNSGYATVVSVQSFQLASGHESFEAGLLAFRGFCCGLKQRSQPAAVSIPLYDIGSVLGLFLLYINDINENIQSSIRLFADDSIIYRKINSNIDHQILQTDLIQLEKWSDKWQMQNF